MLPKIINTVVVLILVVLFLAILASSMTKPLSRDEQVYCTGGVMLTQGKTIYRDFSYVAQMPYHPLLYASLFRILNTTHYLLVGRILSVFCDILVVVCIVGIYRCVFDSFSISAMLLGLAGAVLYVFNPIVDYTSGFAWNNDVVILCVVLSVWLFQTTDFKRKSRYWRIAVIGVLLTFATFMRITTALVQLLFFVILLIQPAESAKQRLKTALPFLVATVFVSIWPVWTITLAPRAFFLNLFSISILNSEWLHRIGLFHNKFRLTFSCLTTPGYFVLIVIAIYLCLAVAQQRRRLTISNTTKLLLAPLLTLTFFIIALVMGTMWKQHLAMPVPLLIISFAYPLLYLRKLTPGAGANSHFKIGCIVIAVCTLAAVVSYPVVLYRIPEVSAPRSWVPIRLHKVSEDIAEKTKSPKLILTLAPLYALEGGCNIYTQFSSGPFVYRVADFMSPTDLDITHTAGTGTLKQLLKKSPPGAVVLGVEPEFLEAALFQTAVSPKPEKWQKHIYIDNGLIVYFRR